LQFFRFILFFYHQNERKVFGRIAKKKLLHNVVGIVIMHTKKKRTTSQKRKKKCVASASRITAKTEVQIVYMQQPAGRNSLISFYASAWNMVMYGFAKV
jgi:hypothetical protein